MIGAIERTQPIQLDFMNERYGPAQRRREQAEINLLVTKYDWPRALAEAAVPEGIYSWAAAVMRFPTLARH